MSAYVLCADSAQIDAARRREPLAGLVAVTPASAWYCQQRGIAYTLLDRAVSAEAMYAFGEATTEAEYRWAAWIDGTLTALHPELARAGFAPARAQLYYLKRCLDAHLLPATLLRRFVEAVHPSRLVVFEQPPPRFPEFTINAGPPFLAWLAPAAAGDLTTVEVWPPVATGQPPPQPDPGGPRLGARLAPAIRRRLVRALRRLRARRPGPRIAWLGRGYDWEDVVPRLETKGVHVIECSEPIVAGRGRHRALPADVCERLRHTWPVVREQAELWAPVDAVTPRLRAVVEPFLRDMWETETARVWGMFLAANRWLAERQVDVMVSVDIQSQFMCAALMAARSLGIPRVMSIHTPPGGAAELQVQDAIGPIQSDIYLLNGAGDEAYFGSLATRFGTFDRGRVALSGSVRLEQLAADATARTAGLRAALRASDRRPIVLYVPTAFEGPWRYFNSGFTSDVAYLELQQRILSACARFPGVRILYKPRARENGAEVMDAFIAERVPNGEVVWIPMTDLLWAVDAVIIDYPSTTLAEAAMTDKPLLVYADRNWGRLLPLAKSALVRRAHVSDTPDEFEAQVRAFLGRGDFQPLTSPDSSFRKLFVTHEDDGHALERATAVVLDTLAERGGRPLHRQNRAEVA